MYTWNLNLDMEKSRPVGIQTTLIPWSPGCIGNKAINKGVLKLKKAHPSKTCSGSPSMLTQKILTLIYLLVTRRQSCLSRPNMLCDPKWGVSILRKYIVYLFTYFIYFCTFLYCSFSKELSMVHGSLPPFVLWCRLGWKIVTDLGSFMAEQGLEPGSSRSNSSSRTITQYLIFIPAFFASSFQFRQYIVS